MKKSTRVLLILNFILATIFVFIENRIIQLLLFVIQGILLITYFILDKLRNNSDVERKASETGNLHKSDI